MAVSDSRRDARMRKASSKGVVLRLSKATSARGVKPIPADRRGAEPDATPAGYVRPRRRPRHGQSAEPQGSAERRVRALPWRSCSAFFSDDRPQVYKKDAAEDAWKRCLAFFDKHLKS